MFMSAGRLNRRFKFQTNLPTRQYLGIPIHGTTRFRFSFFTVVVVESRFIELLLLLPLPCYFPVRHLLYYLPSYFYLPPLSDVYLISRLISSCRLTIGPRTWCEPPSLPLRRNDIIIPIIQSFRAYVRHYRLLL